MKKNIRTITANIALIVLILPSVNVAYIITMKTNLFQHIIYHGMLSISRLKSLQKCPPPSYLMQGTMKKPQKQTTRPRRKNTLIPPILLIKDMITLNLKIKFQLVMKMCYMI